MVITNMPRVEDQPGGIVAKTQMSRQRDGGRPEVAACQHDKNLRTCILVMGLVPWRTGIAAYLFYIWIRLEQSFANDTCLKQRYLSSIS